jgi:hypothetical protein
LLIARRRSGREQARLGSGNGDDFGANGVVTGEHAEVAHPVQAGRSHRRAEPDQQVLGLEQDGASAVFPDALQLELQASVGALREPFESERGAGDIAGEALELFAVATVDELLPISTVSALGDRRSAERACNDDELAIDSAEGARRWCPGHGPAAPALAPLS